MYWSSTEIRRSPIWEHLKQKRIPLSFNLEITARCNNNCRHCYINLPSEDAEAGVAELSSEEIVRIADQATEMGSLWCLVTGGEPLLRPDFEDIYLLLKKKGFLVSVFTNATLVNEDHVKLFKHYPPRDLEVTVYGMTKATYERVTRKHGSFESFQRGLKLLVDNGVPLRMKTMALKSNLHEIHQIAEFCRRHTKDYFRFDPFLHLRYDGEEKRNAEIIEERLSPDEIVAVERADPERISALMTQCRGPVDAHISDSVGERLFTCGAGVYSFSISYNGMFRLCDSLWAPGTTCDLKTVLLSEAWSDLVPRVRNLASANPSYRQTCGACRMVNFCLSCPAHNYLETGHLEGETSYFCRIAHAREAMLREARP